MAEVVKLIESNSKQIVTYEQVTTFADGTPMTDSKTDGVLYRKGGGNTTGYLAQPL